MQASPGNGSGLGWDEGLGLGEGPSGLCCQRVTGGEGVRKEKNAVLWSEQAEVGGWGDVYILYLVLKP